MKTVSKGEDARPRSSPIAAEGQKEEGARCVSPMPEVNLPDSQVLVGGYDPDVALPLRRIRRARGRVSISALVGNGAYDDVALRRCCYEFRGPRGRIGECD